jgi:hypothetical protein
MSFNSSKLIEAEAMLVMRPYLEEKSDGRFVVTSKGTLAKWLQESVGDVLMNVGAEERLIAIELKAEKKHTGNLFLETWSNKNLNARDSHGYYGSNPGWMLKIKADALLYYFLDVDILYSLDVFSLKRWAFGYGKKDNEKAGNIFRFPEKLVSHDQANDTWGRCVPVSVLWNEMPRGAVKKTSILQRTLDAA